MRGWPLFRSLLSNSTALALAARSLLIETETLERRAAEPAQRYGRVREGTWFLSPGLMHHKPKRTKTRAASRLIGPMHANGALLCTPSNRASNKKTPSPACQRPGVRTRMHQPSVAATARDKNSPSITCRKCHPSVPPNRRCSSPQRPRSCTPLPSRRR